MLSNNLNVKDWSYDLSHCSGWQTYFERLFVFKNNSACRWSEGWLIFHRACLCSPLFSFIPTSLIKSSLYIVISYIVDKFAFFQVGNLSAFALHDVISSLI